MTKARTANSVGTAGSRCNNRYHRPRRRRSPQCRRCPSPLRRNSRRRQLYHCPAADSRRLLLHLRSRSSQHSLCSRLSPNLSRSSLLPNRRGRKPSSSPSRQVPESRLRPRPQPSRQRRRRPCQGKRRSPNPGASSSASSWPWWSPSRWVSVLPCSSRIARASGAEPRCLPPKRSPVRPAAKPPPMTWSPS